MVKLDVEDGGDMVSVPLPRTLVDAVRDRADREGVSCEQFIRTVLEQTVDRAPALS